MGVISLLGERVVVFQPVYRGFMVFRRQFAAPWVALKRIGGTSTLVSLGWFLVSRTRVMGSTLVWPKFQPPCSAHIDLAVPVVHKRTSARKAKAFLAASGSAKARSIIS